MDKATFKIAYDGPALANGSMDARDLGPALLGLSNLIEDANLTFNGDKATVRVNVQSGFQPGSFEIRIEIVQSILEAVEGFAGVATFYGAGKILEAIGLLSQTGGTFIKAIKLLKGKKVIAQTTLKTGDVEFKTSVSYDNVIVTKDGAKLFNNPKVRRDIEQVIYPLNADGIDTFESRDAKSKPIESISKEELPYFSYEEEREELEPSESEGTFVIVDLSFAVDHKWRISDGTHEYNVKVSDQGFLRQVQDRRITFGKGDMIRARVRRCQHRTEKRLRSEYEIVKVISRLPGAEQLSLVDKSPE